MNKTNNPIEHKPILYRPDIDGLRTIAVGIVILFHIWPSTLTGGFVGVDVFFVISGFLITSIINKEIQNGTFTFAEFYTRRMKRILPVFYAMILLSSITAYLMLLPDDYIFYARTVLSSGVSLSNLYFYHHNNYFSPNSNEYPLLHTWSLSVEEQYYLFWPVILLCLTRWNKKITLLKPLCVVILFSASLWFSIYCTKYNVNLGFYSIFSRTFELMLGSILALIIAKENIYIKNINHKLLNTIANIISLMGLMSIGLSVWLLTDKSVFPGYIALVPVSGACMILYAGHLSHHSIVNKILATKPFVAIGLISYSLYLWHWPLLAFWHYINPGLNVQLHSGLWILASTFLLSAFSYFLIELPIKRKRYGFKEALIKFQLIPIGLVSIMYCTIVYTKGFLNRIEANISSQNIMIDGKKYCYDQITGNCISGDKTRRPTKVLLIGDSHAGHFSPFWDVIGNNYRFSIKSMSVSSCWPLMNTYDNLPSKEMSKYMTTENYKNCQRQVYFLTNNYKDYDVFILSARWGSYFGVYKEDEDIAFHKMWQMDFNKELTGTIKFLTDHHKKVILMGELPYFEDRTIVQKTLRMEVVPVFLRNSINGYIKMNDNSETNNLLRKYTLKNQDVYYFDTNNQTLITDTRNFPFYNRRLSLYRDFNHLNQTGSELLAEEYISSRKSLQFKLLLESWGISN